METYRWGDNFLIRGDARQALEALAGPRRSATRSLAVKLAYFDPPFDPVDAFPDAEPVTASQRWLKLLRDCLRLARPLFAEDASIWFHIDQRGEEPTRALLDEVFGRDHHALTVPWRKSSAEETSLLVYGSSTSARDLLRGRCASWDPADLGDAAEARAEMLQLFPTLRPFAHAKPTRLVRRIVMATTEPGDVVLDCFAGSGTATAVAEERGRGWIAVERNPHTFRRLTLPRVVHAVARSCRKAAFPIQESRPR
jgi:hypothetical protein